MSCAASHTRRLDSIQCRALRLVDAADPPDPPDPPAQFEPVSPLDSLEHRRDVAALVVFPQGTGAGSATPGWVTTASESRHAKHENGAYQFVMQWRCRVFPVPASTNAPLWAASPGCGTFSRPLSLTSRR
ncbi:hypothetical protein GWK47_054040 [Chionoecetes opilio]|uniref:Uncharacterized protein n=1 Tax=Chionoecetes opilio TaxID=41210 RepID=A0A8J5C7Z9_CHIOP|nr:hypothetical protein GWK47_054040 [Chionoecetes opilio]